MRCWRRTRAARWRMSSSDTTTAAASAGVRVADTGRGIPHEMFERVLEPFVQVGRQLNSTNAGIGLGLAISRELARGMGGERTASNVTNGGCSFLLTLPLRREGQLPIPTAKR